jgi:predicted enzyme related to lactoylglutathione lyase
MTSDVARSRDFYSALFGWTAEEPNPEFGGYFNFQRDGVRVAGCMGGTQGEDHPDVWSIYLATDDARKTLDTAVARGAQVVVPAMPVGDLGTMGAVTDPGGAFIGLWQPGEHKGFGTFGEAGAPSWFELHTRAYDDSLAFYRDVFRWDTRTESDVPEFRYTTQVVGEEQLAGIMDASAFLPDGVPSHWSVYFGSDDTDATIAEAVELGGTVVMPAEDTPYGRLATMADPTGAIFKLVAPNDQMPAR